MNFLQLGKQYIIRSKKISGETKQPYTDEWRVEVLSFCDRNPDRVYVKFLSGDHKIMGKERAISYKNFYFEDFKEYNEEEVKKMENEPWDKQMEYIQKEFARIKSMNDQIRKNEEEYNVFFEETKKKIQYYKEIETEVYALRAAILVIVYMYIMGFIRFT